MTFPDTQPPILTRPSQPIPPPPPQRPFQTPPSTFLIQPSQPIPLPSPTTTLPDTPFHLPHTTLPTLPAQPHQDCQHHPNNGLVLVKNTNTISNNAPSCLQKT
ncbi:hypothetical protein Pcinc_043393 [Petrolisthes cinctipes]|uniref:Uncharacterized protein n=1 Tax=Petrolisthes cinctipes TaxID=88211 RepID=A0AAE1BFY1_PETCI|nr:hypothetical protein Pcinc_043393 [Petrolisthes cinctipes]